MADAAGRLTFTGEAQLSWHIQVVNAQLSDRYKSLEQRRAHERMWLGRVGKQQWTQWEDVLLTEFFEAIRGLILVQEDEARAVEEARSTPIYG